MIFLGFLNAQWTEIYPVSALAIYFTICISKEWYATWDLNMVMALPELGVVL